ncbi:MAG TPA: protocatechuate 3,4-dioxygenase subunit alpha [Gemmatimonadales bacterium]|nr:protocatechuate 3,4-dioxygenase subunit alpha [Gemmatimonadales bacterium]
MTSSQTVGPFFHVALIRGLETLFGPDTVGERIALEGCVTDGAGEPVPDAMIEIWQADAGGRYPAGDDAGADPTFRGFGRSRTDRHGRYAFATVFPGPVPDDRGDLQAPHVLVAVFARGLLHHLITRAYFAGHPLNQTDPVLLSIEDRPLRDTLVATMVNATAPRTFRFDIALQGDRDTVFFDV